MFDVASTELLLVAVIALIVVGPKELPALMRGFSSFMRSVRGLMGEVRSGMETLAREVEDEVDPNHELRRLEGIRPGMTPEEITETIMANREREADEQAAAAASSSGQVTKSDRVKAELAKPANAVGDADGQVKATATAQPPATAAEKDTQNKDVGDE